MKVIAQSHFRFFASVFFFLLLFPFQGEASRRTPVGAEEVEERSVEYTHRGNTFQVTLYCYQETIGRLYIQNAGLAFESLRDELKRKQKKRRKTGKPTRKVLAKLRSLTNQSEEVCISTGPQPSPTPTPSSSPPLTSNGYFEDNGDVTDLGKTAFLIPNQFSANIWTGQTVFTSKCLGCHEERTNRSFQNLRTSTAQSPMFYDEENLPDADLAHLTAYLNRFRDPAAE